MNIVTTSGTALLILFLAASSGIGNEGPSLPRELASYVIWHNEYRPQQALDGKTPAEVHVGVVSTAKSFEPRWRWPVCDDGKCERVEQSVG